MATDTLYEDDFVIWTERQAEALRSASRQVSNLPVDWENLAEEIESVGRSERAEIRRLIGQIVSCLLKLVHSPAVQTRTGWESEVSYARERLLRRLDDAPSLRAKLPEFLAAEIPRAKRWGGRSLRRYNEIMAAEAAESGSVTMTANELLDDDFFLPGTLFARDGDDRPRRGGPL